MKKIKKALALVLALAMIATVVPVASTEAASTAKLSATTATIAVGSKKVITLTTPSTWKKVKTSWKVGKKSVAQIVTVTKKASIRAQKAGETNVKVKVTYAKSSKKGAKRYSKSLCCKVTVKNYLFKSVKQTEKNKLEAVISGDTSKGFKPEDFTITNKATSVVNPVKSVTVDKNDSTKVTIETFADMTDGKDYTVVFDGTTKEFTASDGKVKSVSVDTTTIPYGKETDIEASAKDVNGVVLKSFKYSQAPTGYVFTIETTSGYTNGTKLYLVNKGDTAKAKIVVHSGKYDANGVETENITTEATITAVDPEVVTVNQFQVRVNKASDKTFDTVADNTKVAVNDPATAYFKILNSKGDEIAVADYANYTVETSNKDVMIVGAFAGKKLTITPVAVGNAYLVVKDKKNNNSVVATIAISIVAKREAATLVLDKAAFDASTKVDNAKEVKVSLKDQYGDDMSTVAPSNISVECVAASGTGATKATAPTWTIAAGKVTFDATVDTVIAGTYTYTIKVGKLTKTVVITAKTPTGDTVAYNLVLDNTTMDAVVKSANDKNKRITIKVAALKGGVVDEYVNDFTITVKDKDGKDAKIGDDLAYAAGVLQVTTSGSTVGKLAAGTYTVTATKGEDTPNDTSDDVKLTRSIVITDSQPSVSVERIADKASQALGANGVAAANFKYVYDGKVYTNGTLDGKVNTTITTSFTEVTPDFGTGNIFFKNTTVQIPVADGIYINVKVNLNKTITIE